MVTVQEAPTVRPPETTGTSAEEEPKSSTGEAREAFNESAPRIFDCRSQKVLRFFSLFIFKDPMFNGNICI